MRSSPAQVPKDGCCVSGQNVQIPGRCCLGKQGGSRKERELYMKILVRHGRVPGGSSVQPRCFHNFMEGSLFPARATGPCQSLYSSQQPVATSAHWPSWAQQLTALVVGFTLLPGWWLNLFHSFSHHFLNTPVSTLEKARD